MGVISIAFEMLSNIAYGVSAECFWMIAGFFAVFAGILSGRATPRKTTAPGLLICACYGAVISVVTAFGLLCYDVGDVKLRVYVCGGVNAAMFLASFFLGPSIFGVQDPEKEFGVQDSEKSK